MLLETAPGFITRDTTQENELNSEEIRESVATLYSSVNATANKAPATAVSVPTLQLVGNVLAAAKTDSPGRLEHVPAPSSPMNYAALKDIIMQLERVYPIEGPGFA